MLAKLKNNYQKLIKSKEFKHKGFLCGAFIICDIENIDSTPWQLDFYDKKADTITSYTLGDKIEVTEDAKVFKEENTKIEELDFKNIKIDFDDLKKKLQEILSSRNETPVKITIILQVQKFPVWNIIYITKKFNLLNIKVNAKDGVVLEEKIVPLLSFEKGK